LIHPEKYIGNPLDIKFRSSWEAAFCRYLDMNDKIIKWTSEQPVITYLDLRGKSHRYFVDFYYEIIKNNDSSQLERIMVEIKPAAELIPPVRPLNETGKALENYEFAVRTHIKNKIKWANAFEYAQKNGMKFVIITEDRLIKEGLIPAKKTYKKKEY
jgi:c-di-GMP-related signal transduction protein